MLLNIKALSIIIILEFFEVFAPKFQHFLKSPVIYRFLRARETPIVVSHNRLKYVACNNPLTMMNDQSTRTSSSIRSKCSLFLVRRLAPFCKVMAAIRTSLISIDLPFAFISE